MLAENADMKLSRALNVVVPVATGAVLYYLISPDILFTDIIDRYLHLNFHIEIPTDNNIAMILRYYIFDILWAYSLTWALLYCLNPTNDQLSRLFVTCTIFECVLEGIQTLAVVPGTFDPSDIIVEICVSIIVMGIYRRRIK